MIRHDDTISSFKNLSLCLKKIVGVEQVNILIPSFFGSLMTSQIWISGDENSVLDVFMAKSGGELGCSPSKIENIIFEVLPRITQIFRNVKLLVDFTRFVIVEVLAGCPSSSKSPRSLLWMIMELMDPFA